MKKRDNAVPSPDAAGTAVMGQNPNDLFSKNKKNDFKQRVKKYIPFYFIAAPAIIYYIIFHYIPMLGISLSFFNYGPLGVDKFIGLDNFIELFSSTTFYRAFTNTLILSIVNIVLQVCSALVFALLLNELTQRRFKRVVQTVVYLPHFLSWVVVAAVFYLFLRPQSGAINQLLSSIGLEQINFRADSFWWRPMYWAIMIWKEMGWGTIVFLAALSNLDPNLYEAASIDGASRIRQLMHITLPGISMIIVIVIIMYLSKVFNLFQSVFVLQVPIVYEVSDVLGTFIYRRGFEASMPDYDFVTAAGLFKSLISLVLVLGTKYINKRLKGENIF